MGIWESTVKERFLVSERERGGLKNSQADQFISVHYCVFYQKNIRCEAKFNGKGHGVTFQQRCNLRVAFAIITTNVIYMVQAESTHLRGNLKSIWIKNVLKNTLDGAQIF